MKITIISGSHRNPSQSEKVARYMEKMLSAQDDTEASVFTLADNPLPLWDQSLWENNAEWNELLAPIKQQLSDSDAFVVITPEWHGQVPAGLKNFFMLFSHAELGHKPALIVAVSAGDGGAYPVAELRMSSYKNNRLCYIPEQLIVRHVTSVLNENPDDNDERSDRYLKERITWSLDMLKGYATALQSMRKSTNISHEKYPNGM